MPSPFLYLILAGALAGVVILFVKWRNGVKAGARIAAATASSSVRQLESMRSKGKLPWARSLAESVLNCIEEKEALRERGEDRELFEALLSEISHGFLIVNGSLEIVFENKTLKSLFPRNGVHEGRPLIEVLRDHRLVEVVREAFEKKRRTSGEINIEGVQEEGDESYERVYEIEAAPLPDEPDAGCWVMVRDVTDRVITEQVRKDFVANASHELRTPLTLINGYIETLQDGLLDDREAAVKSLDVMGKHGRRIIRIVEDMLTISKLESGESSLRLEPFDVAECVTDVLDHLHGLIEEREAKVRLDFPEDRTMVGDRFYWDQVFMNLIENALKQNQKPGLRISIFFRKEGDTFFMGVSDDGVGIARADLPFVFKRFYRGARGRSPEVRGTGLGLSIVKRAVEAHGGEIAVESVPGRETVFTVSVPLIEIQEVE